MDSFGAYIVATARHEDYAREAATERQLRQANRERKRATDSNGTRPAHRRHGATRPAIA